MFSQTQLEFIEKCAKQRKNQGEVAVYELAKQLSDDGFFWEGFNTQQLPIIKFCAEECKRQRSGELSVYDMVVAWNYAISFDKQEGMPDSYKHPNISSAFIEYIGRLVEPIDNKKGFRTVPVGVGDGTPFGWIEKAKFPEIPRLLEHLLNAYYSGILDPKADDGWYGINPVSVTAEDEFYFQYEEIHPFLDGNGRSGKIFYNYLKGTLDNPVLPPNFWGGSNP